MEDNRVTTAFNLLRTLTEMYEDPVTMSNDCLFVILSTNLHALGKEALLHWITKAVDTFPKEES